MFINRVFIVGILVSLLLSPALSAVKKTVPEKPVITTEAPIGWNLLVRNPGVYRITYTDLTAWNINPASLDMGTLSLQLKNQNVPLITSANKGPWGVNDYIEFYGDSPKNAKGAADPFTRDNIYRLQPSTLKPSRYLSVTNTNENNKPSALISHFNQDNHLEYELQFRYFTDYEKGTFPRIWYWLGLRAPKSTQIPLDFSHINTLSGDSLVHIELGLQGETHPPVSPAHHAELSINSTLIGHAYWDGFKHYTYSTTFPVSLLTSQQAVLTLNAPGDIKSNPPMDVFLLEYIQYSYPKYLQTNSDYLSFNNDACSNQTTTFQLSGFKNTNIRIIDLNASINYQPDKNSITKAANGSYSFQLTTYPTMTTHQYIAYTPGICHKPLSATPVYDSHLKDTTNRADYMILTYDDFAPELDRLVKWREKQGHVVKVVKISDVYNEFNGGVFSPEAIHSFIQYAYQKWSTPRLKYLFLIGDANWDYKNNLKWYWEYMPNYIPTYIYVSRASNIVSDNYFVALDSTSIKPSLAVGRLSIRNRESVHNYIDKIFAYETTQQDAWKYNSLLVAGDDNMFYDDLNDLASEYLYPSYSITKAYATKEPEFSVGQPDVVNRKKIQDAFKEGIAIAYFAGHGSHGLWANRKLLLLEDIPNLNNQGRYPLVFSMTCFTGRFEYANDTSFDSSGVCELLVNQKQAGAIASFGATGRASVSEDAKLGRAIMKHMLTERVPLLGDIIVKAKNDISDPDMISGYTLFGDPALRVQIPRNQITLSMVSAANHLLIAGKTVPSITGKAKIQILDNNGAVLLEKDANCIKGSVKLSLLSTELKQKGAKSLRSSIQDKASGRIIYGWMKL